MSDDLMTWERVGDGPVIDAADTKAAEYLRKYYREAADPVRAAAGKKPDAAVE